PHFSPESFDHPEERSQATDGADLGGEVARVCQLLAGRERVPHPTDWHLVDGSLATQAPVTRRDNLEVDALLDQCTRERVQEGTRHVTLMARVIVCEEQHPHRIQSRRFCSRRANSRCSSRRPATSSPTSPKPNSITPVITIVITRLTIRATSARCVKRRITAITPMTLPRRNSSAPPIPKNSIGLRPKRNWNQTDSRSRTPTGIRRHVNFDTPAVRGYNGTGTDVSRCPSAAAIATMNRCQSGRIGTLAITSRR